MMRAAMIYNTPRKSPFRYIILAIVILLLLAAVPAYYAMHILMDRYTLSHADPAMIALTNESGMSRAGKLVFLRAHPAFVSDAVMRTACAENTIANNKNGFIEQGCYITKTHRIYLRRMPTNLHALEVSTAAYEMLHPVYISLVSSGHATTLNKIIEVNYATLNNASVTAQVANFAKTEPGSRDLELFSLLATTDTTLSDDLSTYYRPYFTSIQQVIVANSHVQQVLQQSKDQLDQVKSQIDHYNSLTKDAYADSVLRAKAGDQAGDTYYYKLYSQYLTKENAAITQYNMLLKNYNTLVTEYNGTQPVSTINHPQTQTK
jgi:hypothetical protein